MKHLRLFTLLAFATLALTLAVALELHAQSSNDLPKLPDQGSGAGSSGSTTAAMPPEPVVAPAVLTAAAPVPASAERKFKYWIASKGTVHVYPQPSARSAFMRDEHYVGEQSIRVLEIVPGRNKLSWLKVLTPSNKIGYVFSGEVRPANVPKSGKLVQSVNMDD